MNRKKERTIGAVIGGVLTTATLAFALAIVPAVMAQSPATGEIQSVTPEISVADTPTVTTEPADTTVNINAISEERAIEMARVQLESAWVTFDGDTCIGVTFSIPDENNERFCEESTELLFDFNYTVTAEFFQSNDPVNNPIWKVTFSFEFGEREGGIDVDTFIDALTGETPSFTSCQRQELYDRL